jgi:YfiH family protein
MPFQDLNGLRLYRFSSFDNFPLKHAVFTRRGGLSHGPYAELNVGSTVGDDLEHVRRNLELSFEALGRPRASLFDSWLVHGTHHLVADAPRPPEWKRPPQADIIMTDKPAVSLFMRYADCLPLLFYDPRHPAIALAHAGWKGTILGVATAALNAMQQHYGSQPGDVHVAIGPGISAARYEIGPEVAGEVEGAFGPDAEALLPRFDGHTHFDLPAANRLTLVRAGVQHIEDAAICTASHTEDWFSHRAEHGRTGRFGALLALDEQ